MPYAQAHYPFENAKLFEDTFPGDFIAEGIDQTRGWFYTLLVLGTALYGKAPFKNLICFGLVLASDGQKMSKRKLNYPNPLEIVDKYGADAIRLYIINSPVVRADSLRFKEQGVKDILKDVFLPCYNAHRFLLQNLSRLQSESSTTIVFKDGNQSFSNYMDKWIISFTQSLIKFVHKEMAEFHLYTVVPQLLKFIEQLTNWYVRMNRKRLKGDTGEEDCKQAICALFSVIYDIVRTMSPFVPFLMEHMYQKMKNYIDFDKKMIDSGKTDSVHFLMVPLCREEMIVTEIEVAVSRMQTVIELGRVIRDRKTMPAKYPLKEVVIISEDPSVLKDVKTLELYISDELNVRKMTVTTDRAKYGVKLRAEPDHKILGARLKGDFGKVMSKIKSLTDSDLGDLQAKGSMNIFGHKITISEVMLKYEVVGGSTTYEAHSENNIIVLLDLSSDQSMIDEGLSREAINRIQKLRKKAKLVPTDDVTVFYETKSSTLNRVLKTYKEIITQTTKSPLVSGIAKGEVICEEVTKIKQDTLSLYLVRGIVNVSDEKTPFCAYVNVVEFFTGKKATILLENPIGECIITIDQLKQQCLVIFGETIKKSVVIFADEKHKISIKTISKDLYKTNIFCRFI